MPRSDSFKEVTERPCIRCHHALTLDEGQLAYCNVCGAPQIFLSEELLQQAADDVRRHGERAAEATAEGVEPAGRALPLRRARGKDGNRWPLAVELALLSSGIALALALGAVLFSPLLFLDWIWIVSAPILTVSFYNTRAETGAGGLASGQTPGSSPRPLQGKPLTPGFAIRLGLLTGLLTLLSTAVVFTAAAVLARFAFHDHAVDTQLATAFAQVRTTMQAQYGEAAAPVLHMLAVPEFRVGFLLWMAAITAALYLLLAAVTTGLAGLLLSRRRPAQ